MRIRPDPRALIAVVLGISSALSAQAPSFDFRRDTALVDEKLRIVLTGVPPSRLVTVRLQGQLALAQATFISGRDGVVDLTRDAPVGGDYAGVDPMGLFWSARRDPSAPPPAASPNRRVSTAPLIAPWIIAATLDGTVIATDTIWRRAVAANVRFTPVREAGIVGALYEPSGLDRKPAVIVLSGSLGGTTPATNWPGGLASRGYVVLSLPYFNDEGVPPTLMNIPLEYFESAITFLHGRKSVDPGRIAVLGGSRGGELALLLGATYPKLIRAVVAFSPSSVVWPGCCDSTSRLMDSWTLAGKPVPHMPVIGDLEVAVDELSRKAPVRLATVFLHRLNDTAAAARAAIPVERIGGPVLLLTGGDDGMWPSAIMAEQVMARLRRNNFSHSYRHISYDGLGHSIGRPYTPATGINDVPGGSGRRTDAGGTPAGTARGREKLWADVLAFLETSLKR